MKEKRAEVNKRYRERKKEEKEQMKSAYMVPIEENVALKAGIANMAENMKVLSDENESLKSVITKIKQLLSMN